MNKSKAMIATTIAIVACLSMAFIVSDQTESSEGATSEFTKTIQAGVQYTDEPVWAYDGTGTGSLGGWGPTSSIPSGLSFTTKVINNKMNLVLNGKTSMSGSVQLYFFKDGITQKYFTLLVEPGTLTVTYNANGGLINNAATWSEGIVSNGHPTLPSATFSGGSMIFKGWATTSTATTPNVTSSYVVTAAVTFYAVWEQASTSMSSWSATISHGQSFNPSFTTTPSNATISISSAPAGWGISISGKTMSGTVPDAVAPGKYYIILQTSASGWKTTTTTLTVTVPIYIVPPIEKTDFVGNTFKYEPVTNPTNASVSINSVKLNNTTITNSGASMSGRTINLPLTAFGTYEISYTVSASGYTSTTATVRVFADNAPTVTDPPTISGISANQRPQEPRTWDFVATNPTNYSQISWSVDGNIFQTSSLTAVFEFQTSGVYTVKCELLGLNGSTVSATKTVAVLDTFYPELAWVGVQYSVVVQGTPSTDMLTAIWLSASTTTVDTTTYTVISGTPTIAHEGSTYAYSIGGTTKNVTVHPAKTTAPIASFDTEMSDDGMTVYITWTGDYASVVYFDYGDGTSGTTTASHTYSGAGAYVIVATAVNNLGERTASHVVFVDGYDDPTPSTRPLNLTDIERKQGEKIFVPLTIFDGESVTLLGSSTSFVSLVDNVITGDTTDVELGSYDLTVTLIIPDATPVQKTITITIIAAGGGDEDDEDDEDYIALIVKYLGYAIVIIIALVILWILWKIISKRK